MRIGISPAVFTAGSIMLTWHGLFTILAVALGVYLMVRWAKAKGIITDVVLTSAVWAILGGIVGARLVHVIDLWSEFYGPDPVKIVMLWNGGLDVLGGILGGLGAVWLYHAWSAFVFVMREVTLFGLRFRCPTVSLDYSKAQFTRFRKLLDVAALALPLALIVGRIAGILSGSETGTATGLPWGITYTHPDSRAYQNFQFTSTHPAVAYEMLLTGLIFGVLWFLKDRVKPDGMLFAVFMGLYAIDRFFVGFVRLNKAWLSGMGMAQLIALVILIVLVPLVSYRIHLVRPGEEARPARTARRS